MSDWPYDFASGHPLAHCLWPFGIGKKLLLDDPGFRGDISPSYIIVCIFQLAFT